MPHVKDFWEKSHLLCAALTPMTWTPNLLSSPIPTELPCTTSTSPNPPILQHTLNLPLLSERTGPILRPFARAHSAVTDCGKEFTSKGLHGRIMGVPIWLLWARWSLWSVLGHAEINESGNVGCIRCIENLSNGGMRLSPSGKRMSRVAGRCPRPIERLECRFFFQVTILRLVAVC